MALAVEAMCLDCSRLVHEHVHVLTHSWGRARLHRTSGLKCISINAKPLRSLRLTEDMLQVEAIEVANCQARRDPRAPDLNVVMTLAFIMVTRPCDQRKFRKLIAQGMQQH